MIEQEKTELFCSCGEKRIHEEKPFLRCKKCKRWLIRNYEVFWCTELYLNGETLYQRDMNSYFRKEGFSEEQIKKYWEKGKE